MKIKLFMIAVIFALVSCKGEKPEIDKAKTAVEACLKAIDKGEYAKVKTEYYSTEFGSGETEEELSGKFKKLKEVTGDMQSFEVKESSLNEEPGEDAKIILVYAVKHARVTTLEKFVVIIEEGKYKITLH